MPAMNRLRSESNIKGWLFKILRNAWLNHLRRRRTSSEVAWSDVEDGSVGEIAEPSQDSYQAFVSKMEREQAVLVFQSE